MENRGKSTFKALLSMGLLLPALLGLTNCRLTETGPHANIYPEDGSTDVPVNAVIEVQFPADLKLDEKQMNKNIFSVRECTVSAFDYLDPTKNAKEQTQTAAPTATPDPTKKTDQAATSTTPDKKEAAVNNQDKKYGATIKVIHEHGTDSSKTIFNYLIINPENRDSPLDFGKTYCVHVAELVNADGVKIKQHEISFTTIESPNFAFDTDTNVEFLGNRLAPTIKGKDGKFKRDYMVLNFRDQFIRPDQIKQKMKVCLADEKSMSTSDACKDFGKEVQFDIFLVEDLKGTPNGTSTPLIRSKYGLFAVSPHLILTVGQKFKIVVDVDLTKNDVSSIGTRDETYIVDEDPTLNIDSALQDITDSDGKPVSHVHYIQIGSGS